MTRPSVHWLLAPAVALALALGMAACGGGDTIDTLVVVQETNVPDPPPPCPDSPFRYTVSVDNTCGGPTMATVCSDQVLCQSQIDAAVAPLASCDQLMGYDIQVPASCQ